MKEEANRIDLLRKNHQETCEQLQHNLSLLLLDVEEHSERSHSTKEYHDKVLVPLIRGAALLGDMIGEANVKFSEEYVLAAHRSEISTSDLEDQIIQWDQLILEVQGKLKELAVSELDPLNKAFQISKCTTLLGLYGSIKRELKHELAQYERVIDSSSAIIEEIACLNKWINQGYELANGCWDKTTAVFTEPEPEEFEWVTQLKEAEQKWLEKHQSKKYLLDPFEH
ncbi:hypothetical protein [Candidatus Enterococcus clewellii]|uniref:LXG domain-containing protein n=1 Tax=Candidatus Enterococcus clewellii TaxID=1834193 RepID=A0A242K7A0_9ENTE|nr:hypothetical protein [Enterococcus sp. 9E7_DIV0242]OTP15983.1 hypothetical protein A5888_002197 [Enterococcus sp. 9E7_DIV0242]